jgi:hypothetical protein
MKLVCNKIFSKNLPVFKRNCWIFKNGFIYLFAKFHTFLGGYGKKFHCYSRVPLVFRITRKNLSFLHPLNASYWPTPYSFLISGNSESIIFGLADSLHRGLARFSFYHHTCCASFLEPTPSLLPRMFVPFP